MPVQPQPIDRFEQILSQRSSTANTAIALAGMLSAIHQAEAAMGEGRGSGRK